MGIRIHRWREWSVPLTDLQEKSHFYREKYKLNPQILIVQNCAGCLGLEDRVGWDNATKMNKINTFHLH